MMLIKLIQTIWRCHWRIKCQFSKHIIQFPDHCTMKSSITLHRTYHQTKAAPECRKFTAFITPWGFYEWVRVLFRLTNAVTCFKLFKEYWLEAARDEYVVPYLMFFSSIQCHLNNTLVIYVKYFINVRNMASTSWQVIASCLKKKYHI